MEQLFFLFLAGCSHDGSLCEQIGPPVPFTEAVACESALLERIETIPTGWPMSFAVCSPGEDSIAALPEELKRALPFRVAAR